MAERTNWTLLKKICAAVAGLAVLLLMTPLHEPLAELMSVSDAVADQWFTLALGGLILACAAVLHREVASLKITVVLLSLGLVLVFVGTLAQTRLGIWEVINGWFRGRVVEVHTALFTDLFDKSKHNKPLEGPSFPFPGGFLVLGLLTVNMIAAMGAKIASDVKSSARGRLLRRHAGIYILHVGLLVMFAGEFVTGLYAEEGNLAIKAGQWSDYVEDAITTELAFVDRSDPEQDRHIVIPQKLLARHAVIGGDGEVISHPDLPFDIRVEDYMPNCEISVPDQPERFRGAARRLKATEVPPVPGTEMQRGDMPAVYVTLLDKKDQSVIGTWLCLAWPELAKLRPGELPPGAKTQPTEPGMPELELRFARRYLPYRVYLDKVEHDVYDGTQIPHNFSSDVRIKTPGSESERKSHIWMNHPLRYDAKAFYQKQMIAGEGLTVLQVVNNPGIWLPYISCGIVTLGLVVQFSVSLFGYTRRSLR